MLQAQTAATRSVADSLIAVISNFVKSETEKAAENAARVTDSLTSTAAVVNKAADSAVASLSAADARASTWTQSHIAALSQHGDAQCAMVEGACI